jgi:hypothetical protein
MFLLLAGILGIASSMRNKNDLTKCPKCCAPKNQPTTHSVMMAVLQEKSSKLGL